MSVIASFSDDYYGVNQAYVGNWMLADGYSVAVNTMEVVTTRVGLPGLAPRTGRTCLQVGGASPAAAWQTPGDQATLIVGRGFIFTTSMLWRIWQFRENDGVDITEHISLFRTTNNALQVRRGTTTETGGGTVLATSDSGALIPGAGNWNFIEMKGTIDNTNGVVVVRVNRDEVINATGLDTRNGANAVVNEIAIDEDGDVFIDGGYILDTNGTRLNDFPGGELRFYTLRANAAGDQADLTPTGAATNHECVDDLAITTGTGAGTTEDGDTDYNVSAVGGDKDLLGMEDLPVGVLTVHWVEAVAYARREEGGAAKVKVKTKLSGVEAESAALDMAVTYSFARHVFETAPGGGAWTPGKVNSTQGGYEADDAGLRVSANFFIVAVEGSSGFLRRVGAASDLVITTSTAVQQTNVQRSPAEATGGLVITTYAPTLSVTAVEFAAAQLIITTFSSVTETEITVEASADLIITTYVPEANACFVWIREAPASAVWQEAS